MFHIKETDKSKIKMDIPTRNGKPMYDNYPMESSFSESITSKTPLTSSRDSPSPETPNGRDIQTENPYEMPLDFEVGRRRHEEEMIAQRSSAKKKNCLIYEPANGVTPKRLERQFSDEEQGTDLRYIHHNAKTYKWTFVCLFLLVVVSLGMGALGVVMFLGRKTGNTNDGVSTRGLPSNQKSTQMNDSITEGLYQSFDSNKGVILICPFDC